MATTNSEGPCLAVRPCKDRSGWYVEIWWLRRPLEEIGHFHTYGDARRWIELEIGLLLCASRDRINDAAPQRVGRHAGERA